MGGFAIKIEGLKDLDAKLRDLGTTKAKEIGWKAVKAGGQVLQAAVRGAAPTRPALPSGTALPPGALAHDIELHTVYDEAGHQQAVVRPGHFTAYAARFVEYGHRMVKGGASSYKRGRLQGRGKQIGDVPAHPFIRPAFEAARAAAAEVTIVTLREEIEKAAKQ